MPAEPTHRPPPVPGGEPGLAQGARIGRYVVLGLLGRGGMGEVYAAYDQLEVQDCNGTSNQAWTITADANIGGFTLKNVASNRCLDVRYGSAADGTLLQLYDCFGGPSQKFKLSSSY